MQYTLTQEEYEALKNEPHKARSALKEVIMDLCTKVCNNMPCPIDNELAKRVSGCIKTAAHEHYCDDCPVQEQCPEPNKHWSK